MPTILADAEISLLQEDLRARATFGTRAQRRDATGCLLGMLGLRIDEVCRLRRSDLDSQHATINVATLKGGRRRQIPLDPQLLTACQWASAASGDGNAPTRHLLRTRSGAKLDPRNLRRRWTAWCKEALGRPVRFHDLRHSVAHWIWNKSGDIFAVQRILGHRKIETTHMYLNTIQQLAPLLPGHDYEPT